MAEFVVTVELMGCDIDGAEYRQLDGLMESETFRRNASPLAGSLIPANLRSHPENPPHATYIGQTDLDRSRVHLHLERRVRKAIRADCSVVVMESHASAR